MIPTLLIYAAGIGAAIAKFFATIGALAVAYAWLLLQGFIKFASLIGAAVLILIRTLKELL